MAARLEFSLEKIWHSSDTKRDAVHSAPFLILVANRFRLMRRALIDVIRENFCFKAVTDRVALSEHEDAIIGCATYGGIRVFF
jgi:hypothetical protein